MAPEGRSRPAAMHFRIIRNFNQKVRNCFLGLLVGYGWFVVVGDGRPGLLLCGLGGLVCCCVDWVAWSSSFWGLLIFLSIYFKINHVKNN